AFGVAKLRSYSDWKKNNCTSECAERILGETRTEAGSISRLEPQACRAPSVVLEALSLHRLILQAEKVFLLADGANLYVHAYDGKLVTNPKWPGLRPDLLNAKTLSLSNDTIAVREKNDEKHILFFDAASGKALNDQKPFAHTTEVMEVALNQGGSVADRRCAFVDRNRDLFLCFTRKEPPNNFRVAKLGETLCVVLLNREFGKNPHLVSFAGDQVVVRRSDGALIHSLVPPYALVLHEYSLTGKWEAAVRLCRFVKDETLWACLAAMATNAKDLTTAEVAYAAIDEADKVNYIKYIKEIPLREVRAAEMALLAGNVKDAEGILLQNGLVFRAIMMHLQLFHWERALDLAVKHKTHLDTVLGYRKRYLDRFERQETNKKFEQFSQNVKIDWNDIRNKVEMEFQKELDRARGSSTQKGSNPLAMGIKPEPAVPKVPVGAGSRRNSKKPPPEDPADLDTEPDFDLAEREMEVFD
ncbi:unnamed protein product, partial [Notodromas monacha]